MASAEAPASSVGRFIALDTDAFSWLYNRTAATPELDELVAGRRIVLPFPVVAELRAGYKIAGWKAERVTKLESAIASCVVIPSTDGVAHVWSDLRKEFRNRLKGEGINDMWIAACCLVHRVSLVTGNKSDFAQIQTKFPLELHWVEAPKP